MKRDDDAAAARAGQQAQASMPRRQVVVQCSSLQLPQLVDVDRQPAAVDRDDQAEADARPRRRRRPSRSARRSGRPGCRACARRRPARGLPASSISSRQSQIAGGWIGARTAPAPIGEDQRPEHPVPLHAHRPGGPSTSIIVPASLAADLVAPAAPHQVADGDLAGSSRPVRRRASTTAPTAATSSRIEATSNASRKSVRTAADLLGVPKPSQPVPSVEPLRPEPRTAIAELDEQRAGEQRARPRRPASRRPRSGSLAAAHVGDDEHVQHHHRARVDDHLRGGHELRPQQQEQRGQRQQVQTSASTA